ncbi:PD-(D/E)XK nuclease family transposase, partial [Anaerovibrio sp.]|uniref:PD-(D/E)XK nuclease family transposase n=1 Tax=Anaerovibrio sp. TaxID=1872532 RepID=UPI003F17F0E7
MVTMEELKAQAIYAIKYKLRLIDDAFMRKVFEGHDECVELVLQIVLDKPELKVISSQVEYTITSLQGQEIRLDIRAVFDGKIVNIEVQRADSGAGIKRARRNSSYMDASQEDIGQYGEELAETYVIFITEKDKFRCGLPLYHIERCIMETGQNVHDGAHIIYVNGAYRGDDALGRLMHDFFCTRAEDMHYPVLAERVRQFKETKEGVSSMSNIWDELLEKSKELGLYEGRIEGERQGRLEGERQGRLEGRLEGERQGINNIN